MKKIFFCLAIAASVLACKRPAADYYRFETLQPNTAQVLWNPADFDFEAGNAYYLEHFAEMEQAIATPGCSSWRNGRFHGRNLDWYQADYGCLILQMPKGGKVKHASVALLNASSAVTQQFVADGILSEQDRRMLPCAVVDGINDAGVAININIVPHTPGNAYITDEGDLSSQCVVRYVLDNAGSVDEAISLLAARKIRQSIVELAGDETHYMISDAEGTAVVEFDCGEMTVTRFASTPEGCFSPAGNPAIMTNLYDFCVERYGLNTPEFFEHSPYGMGAERWTTIRDQYSRAALSAEDNLRIAESVWYFKNFMADKTEWISENAVPTAWGHDAEGWFFFDHGTRVACADCPAAQRGFWDAFMPGYWAEYESRYGQLDDPHVKGNTFWETSHTVVYDLREKKGYLCPFENFYSADGQPIVISIPE